MTNLLAVVAEPRRQDILRLIWDRERPAGEIAESLPISFPAVSQHLARLREAGAVAVRREGRRRYYRALPSRLGSLAEHLERVWAERLDDLAHLAESLEEES